MEKIRNLEPDDVDQIIKFKEKSVKINFPGCPFDSDMYRNHMLRYAKLYPGTVKVVLVDDEVAGYIWFKIINSTVGMYGRVEHIYVDDKHQGKGLGKKLMNETEEFLAKHGIKRVKLTVTKSNDAAMKLYENLGYSVKRYAMEKDL